MSKVESRLEHLLQNYTFAPMAQVFADELASFEAEQQVGYRYPKHNQAYENHYSDPGRAILPAPSARRIVPKTVR